MKNNLILVDTSAWLGALRKDFIPTVKDRIDTLLTEGLVVTTGMIKLELLGGTKTEKEFQRLKGHLDSLECIETTSVQWEKAYELAFTLRRNGVTVPFTDILIAGCALTAGSTVMHADAHFDLIAKHSGLKVASFVEAVKAQGMAVRLQQETCDP